MMKKVYGGTHKMTATDVPDSSADFIKYFKYIDDHLLKNIPKYSVYFKVNYDRRIKWLGRLGAEMLHV